MNLPDDLINEILYFVPPKSLYRFKCVCKSWNSIIKNQNLSYLLIRNHNNFARSKLVTSLFGYDNNDNLKSHCKLQLELPPFCSHSLVQYCDDDVRVVGPCNGLVCISILSRSEMEIILWNLSTSESRTLPPFVAHRYLSFDPVFGFGFDSDANDYKVVKFRQCLRWTKKFYVEIYSANKNCWTTYESDNYLGMLPDYEYIRGFRLRRIDTSSWVAVVFNKYCCWLGRGLVGGEIILSFDMSREVFLRTLLPSDALHHPEQQTSEILPLHDSLALILGSYTLEESTFQIWTIKDLNAEGSSWTKMAIIGPIVGHYRSLAFRRNYDSLMLEDFEFKRLVSYDLRLHKTQEMGIDVARLRFDMAFDYSETSVAMPTRSYYLPGKPCKRRGRILQARIARLQEEEDRLAETKSKLKDLHLPLGSYTTLPL